MLHLDYRDARPIYAQILDGFREQIRSGVLQVGDKMPSVRELAAQLTINPNTIQRAYRELEAGGYIASVPGKGCFVCAPSGAAGKETAALLETFDQTVQALLSMDVTKEELMMRLLQQNKG